MELIEHTPQTNHEQTSPPQTHRIAPQWAALLGALAFGILYAALPEHITPGPSWLPLAIEVILSLPIVVTSLLRHPLSYTTRRIFLFLLLGIITLALLCGVVLLVISLTVNQQIHGSTLLRTAVLLWLSNIVVFGLWYWEIDGGGPVKRHHAGHKAADFLFPQQTDGNQTGWVPHFVDYLFLAFTGATALSPTDTYPLSRPAKALMMVEAVISMLIIVILAGRAVNIL